ncbi:hypothetical protein CEXT_181791 [Caerostris extrusa]|uniref:Uncharacterized protein n=1 Tax=Caerostris extrusa TaxID=172846 RepID=A0AAV4UV51_CAEEX|nr:hypothetical protein CEXT_181791 [Caerostris extrusa]
MNNPGTRRHQINRKLITSLFEAKLRNAFPSSLSKARPKDIFQCNILHIFDPPPITSTGESLNEFSYLFSFLNEIMKKRREIGALTPC